MTYPVVVFIMALLMCGGMLLFIVPVFQNMFTNLGGELPLPTQILVYMSTGLRYGSPFILVGHHRRHLGLRRWGHTLPVRERLDPLKLKMPVFGPLVQKIALARFARNFGTLLSSGVPILQCLDIVADTTGSTVIAKALREVQESVRGGESISGPLTKHAVFPTMIVQMMSVGEDTGAMDAMLEKIAEFYRPGGRGDHRSPDRPDRAVDDRRPRVRGRRHDHRFVHADLQGVRPDRLN
jgi:type IV pilus assembly protein PilC